MFFKPFDDDEVCHTCGKKYNDLVSGKEYCEPCDKTGRKMAGEAPLKHHVFSAVELFFNFQFLPMVGAIIYIAYALTQKVKLWIRK